MIVYEHPFSPYAQKVKIALREKGLAFEARVPDGMGSGVSATLDRLNPRGEVPALVDGEAVIFDSTIILEYIEDTHPSPPLLPTAAVDRARARMIEDICDTQFEAINWGILEIRFFKRGDATLGEAMLARAAEQTAHMHAWLESALADRDWLVGDAFGWADLSAVPHVLDSVIFGLAPAAGSALARWYERVSARPSVAATIAEAMAVLPFMENVGEYFVANKFKREYRDHRLEWIVRSGGLRLLQDGLANDDVRFTDIAGFSAHRMGTPGEQN
jgi:glutathione S-transferase/RNA polymerase-associated protein